MKLNKKKKPEYDFMKITLCNDEHLQMLYCIFLDCTHMLQKTFSLKYNAKKYK